MMNRMWLAAAVVGLAALSARAAEDEAAAKQAALVGDLAMAGELAAFGRGLSCQGTSPKDFKSPESLALAGGILLRAHKATAGKMAALDAPKDAKGQPVAGEAAPSLEKQAKALFDEASAMALELNDKARAEAVEAIIKREKNSEPDRGGVGGPRTITRVLQPGETHNYTVAFYSGQPAALSMTSTGPARIQFDLNHVGGGSLLSTAGLNASHSWVPVKDGDNVRKFTITLYNQGRRPTTYTMVAN